MAATRRFTHASTRSNAVMIFQEESDVPTDNTDGEMDNDGSENYGDMAMLKDYNMTNADNVNVVPVLYTMNCEKSYEQ